MSERSEAAMRTVQQADEILTQAKKAYDQAWKALRRAETAHFWAREAYAQAWRAHHQTLGCPDCPWDGHSIFGEMKR